MITEITTIDDLYTFIENYINSNDKLADVSIIYNRNHQDCKLIMLGKIENEEFFKTTYSLSEFEKEYNKHFDYYKIPSFKINII